MKVASFKQFVSLLAEHSYFNPHVEGRAVTVAEFAAEVGKHDPELGKKVLPYLEAASEVQKHLREKTEAKFGNKAWGI